ncbi:LysR substrate-binding domain-containing protein [Filimonas effusa]|uniref:LysR family transcriptional regulator n=1 Tax=Filimonas effusa TaxID=2508721 RepID=A0A4Q1D0U2_9BACT|nr:LysR substrate-binding domain-containing protein [Filimonas effusa]RXK80844.1 LysR family transcriptional regulator [Filimonas effusa]
MELRQLNYFLKAKELLNFTEAANHLHISQSTLSQQVKQLEDEVGVPLFDRIGKRIRLTEAGHLFAAYAARTVNAARDGLRLLDDLSNLNTGHLVVGLTYGLRGLVIPSVNKFAKQFPGITIRIFFGTSEEILEKLQNQELDFAVCFQDDTDLPNLEYQLLFYATMSLIVAAHSPLAQRESISLKEVAKLSLILPAQGYSTRKFVDTVFARQHLKPNIAIEINDIPTLLDLARTGNWHTILTQTTVQAQTPVPGQHSLKAVPIEGNKMVRQAVMITLAGIYKKKAVIAFETLLLELAVN